MKILLDTHTFLWAISDDPRLSANAEDIYMDSGNELFFSTISYWEISIKISIGKLILADNWQQIIDREMINNGIKWLDLKKEHIHGIIDLDFHHRDPFDRLLIAQAQHEELAILTIDKFIAEYNVKTLW
ncbi:MAG: type II toxin-antitoxin system VapC family toxin [Spirochaetales bacterium]|nr:type II toxin-antitoxin system VapC family toxin [Spirochaetales bacterium]